MHLNSLKELRPLDSIIISIFWAFDWAQYRISN